MAWIWLSSGFMLPLGVRLHSKRFPSNYVSTNTTNYYKNHRSVEWARITEPLPRLLSLNIFMKFLFHGLNNHINGKTRFQNLSLFSLAIAEELPTKKPGVKSSSFPIMSCIIFILKSAPRSFPRLFSVFT